MSTGWQGKRPGAAAGYGNDWRKLRRRKLAAQPLCAICGAPATDVDHIVARARGGTEAWANLRSLCRACHRHKTAVVDSKLPRRQREPERHPGGPS